MKKILIIEDERPMAKILQMKLKHEGYEAECVFNGQEGLEKIKETKYDLIVLDLIMPVVDGFQVLEAMNKEGIDAPVIVASNLSQPGDEDRSKKLGAVDYFIKSNTSLSDLVGRITHFLSIKK